MGLKQEIEEALGGSRKVDVVTENALPPGVRERVLREAVALSEDEEDRRSRRG